MIEQYYYHFICFLMGTISGAVFLGVLFMIKMLWLMREISDMVMELGDD